MDAPPPVTPLPSAFQADPSHRPMALAATPPIEVNAPPA
jgi:hypothetical protein